MKSVKPLHAICFSLSICLVASCARAGVSGVYVADHQSTLLMVHLVQSPPGHLTGTLVLSNLNRQGLRQPDSVDTIKGSITHGNISLKINGQILIKGFGQSGYLVGTLNGRTLNLSAGTRVLVFHHESEREYQAQLTALDTRGEQIHKVSDAYRTYKLLKDKSEKANQAMRDYIAWTQKRIDRTQNLKHWYLARIAAYKKCLKTIQPLAARGVPSWHWQHCVISIQNDAFYRQQTAAGVQALVSHDKRARQQIGQSIADIESGTAALLNQTDSICAYSKSPSKCHVNIRKLRQEGPNAALNPTLLHSYHASIPKARTALANDEHTIRSLGEKLNALAKKASSLLDNSEGKNST